MPTPSKKTAPDPSTKNRIEKNVPLPTRRVLNDTPNYRDMVEAMAVGDSFVLKGLTSSGAWSRLMPHARRVNFKLTIRAVADGVRVWRVS